MLCIPICAQTTESALALMEQASPLADCLELRIDQIRDCNLEGMTINGIPVTELLAAHNSKGDGDDVLHRKHQPD